MNNPLKIIILIILIFALILVAGYFYNMDNNPANPINNNNPQLLRECPDEMIVNRMPGTSPQSSYYIVDGERREISEYDANWVEANCQVPEQEVY